MIQPLSTHFDLQNIEPYYRLQNNNSNIAQSVMSKRRYWPPEITIWDKTCLKTWAIKHRSSKIMQDSFCYWKRCSNYCKSVYEASFEVDHSSLSTTLIWAWYNCRLEVILCLHLIKGSPLNLSFSLVKWCQEDRKNAHSSSRTKQTLTRGAYHLSAKTSCFRGQPCGSVVLHWSFWKRRTTF